MCDIGKIVRALLIASVALLSVPSAYGMIMTPSDAGPTTWISYFGNHYLDKNDTWSEMDRQLRPTSGTKAMRTGIPSIEWVQTNWSFKPHQSRAGFGLSGEVHF